MKKMNKKLITLMFAGALCAATMGAAMQKNGVEASAATAQSYTLSNVFTTTNVKTEAVGNTDGSKVTSFVFKDEGTVLLRQRDLALKWYTGAKDSNGNVVATYLNAKFAFADLNFEKIVMTVECGSAWASEDDKAINTVTFTNDGTDVYAAVNDGTAKKVAKDIDFTLAEGADDGEYKVMINGEEIGSFTNVGAYYSDYSEGFKPLTFKAEVKEGQETTALNLLNLNGQRFDNASGSTDAVSVTDTAAPVLVMNEDVSGFQLGTVLSFSYEKIDVLQNSGLTESKSFYQYNPGNTDEAPKYKTYTTSPYLSDSVYEMADGEKTTVYAEAGMEYISIKIKLGDKTYSVDSTGDTVDEYEKVTYDLSWYALETVELDAKFNETRDAYKMSYICIDQNTDGPRYTILNAIEGTKTNQKTADYETLVDDFQKDVDTAAGTLKSNESIKLPSCKWLISDNNGYRNLQFKISYYKPSSSSASVTSTLSYSGLSFTCSEEGLYKFKIFATDKAGNSMYYYTEDNELVEITSTTVWDIEEIPEFNFTIKNQPLSVKNATSTSSMKSTEVLDTTYTMSTFTVLGASEQKSNYALYKINGDKANLIGLTADDFVKVSYTTLQDALEGKLSEVKADVYGNKDYFPLYIKEYAKLLVSYTNSGTTAEQIEDCFVRIEEFNSKINEEDHPDDWEASDNKFNWNPTSRSFKTAEEGNYLIFADIWEAKVPAQRATAFKVVIVESKAVTIKGENEWLKNNILSVVLFSIAALMLVLIIILLLIKPSDETLEDVDTKALKAKKAKKQKKSK